MKLIPALSCTIAFAALAWSATPSVAPSLHDAAFAPPVYLQSSVALALVLPAVAPPPLLGSFGTSVMPPGPAPSALCSTNAIGVDTCSATAAGQRCSAFNDNDNFCSVDLGPIATVSKECSALGDQSACTVLPPSFGAAPSFCSTRNTTNITGGARCSVRDNPSGARCSTKGVGLSRCSALEADWISQCSVINVGATNRGLCSTKFNMPMPAKSCSAFQVDAQCSVIFGGKGRCTTFGAASPGSCSSFAGGAHCSVIGGPAGDPCNQ